MAVVALKKGWEVVAGPGGAERGGFDGAVWCWTLQKESRRVDVFVHVCGGILATPSAVRDDRASDAIASHGRTEVERHTDGTAEPPRLIEFRADRSAPLVIPAERRLAA